MNKPTIAVDLSGPLGNIYALIGLARNALCRSGQVQLVDEVRDRVLASDSYEHALDVIREYVDIQYIRER